MGASASALLTIQTGTQATIAVAHRGGSDAGAAPPWRAAALALWLASFGVLLHGARSRRRTGLGLGGCRRTLGATALVSAAWLTACGGSGDGAAQPIPAPITPSGTYNVTLTASSASNTQTISYVLTVK